MGINRNFDISNHPVLAEKLYTHETTLELIKVERGWLGQFWGLASNVANNVAALLAILSFLLGFIYTIFTIQVPPKDLPITIKDVWSIITPLITLFIGYLFGDKRQKK